MSLTLPTTYSASSKLGNIQENWIVQLFHQESYLSFDGTDDSVNLGATTGASAISLDNGDDLTVAFGLTSRLLGQRNLYLLIIAKSVITLVFSFIKIQMTKYQSAGEMVLVLLREIEKQCWVAQHLLLILGILLQLQQILRLQQLTL